MGKELMGQRVSIAAKIIFVLILVYCFLVSIGLMGAAFKGFGKGFAESLISSTSNPFVGLFIGVLATSLVQSSSTTTSIVVGMVGSGVLTVSNAIPIVMGANIGTTVTNTIVSLGHVSRREEFRRAIAGATVHDFFNLICVLVMFPLNLATGFLEKLAWYMEGLFDGVGGIKFTSPIKTVTKPAIHAIEHVLKEWLNLSDHAAYIAMVGVSVVILFFALIYLVKTMRSLIIERVESVLDDVIGKNAVLAIVGGAVLTAIIQSSSITTSLMVPMIAAGILSIEAAFPIVIGANIGTTGTAILASFATGNPSAIVIAFVHFLFNLIGVLVIYPIKPFRTIPINLAKALGDLAHEKRHYAIIYVLGVFFVVPGLLILVYKLLT
jgi:solute carrier family 34 (sodium-dependent phosphate cotransporter)